MINPLHLTDGYKLGHNRQYPPNTTLVYSNLTARSAKYAPEQFPYIVSFGQQMVMKMLHDIFQEGFFNKPKHEVCQEAATEFSMYLGEPYDVKHFERLHDLGYLPICVKAIKEGNLVPIRVPVLTIYNTHTDFMWITNYLETILSNMLWKGMTSATISYLYKRKLLKFAKQSDENNVDFVDFQGHDFSMRGLSGIDTTFFSGLGHLSAFKGTDTIPAIYAARKYYNATGFVAGSVNATEHSVMCAGTGIYIKDSDGDWEKYGDAEIMVFKRLITEVYPTGIVSIVSDTWDLWKVLTEYLPALKEDILTRDGKVVIRPDSGDPVDIVCGNIHRCQSLTAKIAEHVGHDGFVYYSNPYFIENEKEKGYYKSYFKNGDSHFTKVKSIEVPVTKRGVVELLWDVFGGTVNSQGYKVLDSHIGCIYGDSITLDRAEQICTRLMDKSFASTNIVLGIGSYTYQMNTRDTWGFAVKATYCEYKSKSIEFKGDHGNGYSVESEVIHGVEIFKDPVTDDGIKKSARGLLTVVRHEEEGYMLVDQVNWTAESNGELEIIYKDGKFYNQISLEEVRNNVNENLLNNL